MTVSYQSLAADLAAVVDDAAVGVVRQKVGEGVLVQDVDLAPLSRWLLCSFHAKETKLEPNSVVVFSILSVYFLRCGLASTDSPGVERKPRHSVLYRFACAIYNIYKARGWVSNTTLNIFYKKVTF